MPKPSCPKCGKTEFEQSPIVPTGAKFTVNTVHCSDCGYIIGVLPGKDVAAMIYKLADALNVRIDDEE